MRAVVEHKRAGHGDSRRDEIAHARDGARCQQPTREPRSQKAQSSSPRSALIRVASASDATSPRPLILPLA